MRRCSTWLCVAAQYNRQRGTSQHTLRRPATVVLDAPPAAGITYPQDDGALDVSTKNSGDSRQVGTRSSSPPPLQSQTGGDRKGKLLHDDQRPHRAARHSRQGRTLTRIGTVAANGTFDLGTTLVVNSKTNQLHLNQSQQDAIFAARKELYQTSLRQIVIVLQSHLTPLEKCHRLVLLHDRLVVKNRLRLRADTYEEIFHMFYGVSMLGRSDVETTTSFHGVASATAGQTAAEASPHRGGTSDDGAVARDIHTQTSPFLHPVWTMYRYMIDSGTNPTPRIVQHVMGLLSRVSERNIDIEARAHSLTMDCDRFKFPPTEFTVIDYCRVCTINHAMHLAMARVTDLYTRHERHPSAGIAATLLHGLTVNGHHKQALTFIGTLQNVAMTPSLLHATLQAGRYSEDPSSAFAFYESLQGSGMRPTYHTIGILIESALRMSQHIKEEDAKLATGLHARMGTTASERSARLREQEKRREKLRRVVLGVVLKQMTKYKVRVNHRTLNKLLECLVDIGHRNAFVALCRALIRRQGRRAVFTERYPQDWVIEAEGK